MKFKRLYLLIGVFLLLSLVGCENQSKKNVETSFEFQTEIQENLQNDDPTEKNVGTSFETQTEIQEDLQNDDPTEIYAIETEEIDLPRVINNNYSKAYAVGLFEGLKIPSEEAGMLIEKFEGQIENTPRLVVDYNDKVHIIWTNNNMFLVIDGRETKLKVSDCIFTGNLPELPDNLEKLEYYHKSNEKVKFGIAENAFLEDLCTELEKKGIKSSNGLFRVRFYNDNGKAVAVYSLTEKGELYINSEKASEFFNREKGG